MEPDDPNTCVSCGCIIPEGDEYCDECLEDIDADTVESLDDY